MTEKRDRKLTGLKNGIGSYALKNGDRRYRVVYRAAGKVHTRGGFTTKRAAEVWHNQNRVSMDTGNHVAPQGGRTLFGDWYEQWQATTAELRPSTRARDESYARNHILPTFASLPPAEHQSPGGADVGGGVER